MVQICTPPSASTIRLKPLKSTSTKWSIFTPVRYFTARTTHLRPPALYAALNLPVTRVPSVEPSALQLGRVTQESRGMLIPNAFFRSAEMCSRIAVSDWPLPLEVVAALP